MQDYIGLDLSMKEAAISVRSAGARVWRGKCSSDPARIAQIVRKRGPDAVRVVFETRINNGREMYSVDIYSSVRRACLKDGMSGREAARYFNKDRKTIAKMLRHELPPGYQRSEPRRRPALDGFVGVIDEILRTDKALIKK